MNFIRILKKLNIKSMLDKKDYITLNIIVRVLDDEGIDKGKRFKDRVRKLLHEVYILTKDLK